MTLERQKAKELVMKFHSIYALNNYEAKQCALIALDEIIKVYKSLDEDADIMFKTEIEYWQEVKQEIEKL